MSLVPIGQAAAAAPPSTYRGYQMNMCMWGARYYVKAGGNGKDTCFPDPHVWKDGAGTLHFESGYTATEKSVAEQKRQTVIDHVKKFGPDAVTINEACKNDLEGIVTALRAAGLSYTFISYEVGRGTGSKARQCSAGRGAAVNGIIAHGFQADSKQAGYFETHGYRSWVCGVITSGMRVCTAHLSLPGQDWGGRVHQPIECARLRDELASTGGPVVFSGDVNMKGHKHNCAPSTFWGLRDLDVKESDRTAQSGLQHIYYSPGYTRGQTCGEVHHVLHTDHKGFLIDLKSVPTRTRGMACTWRDVWK
ncbi:endonuclease/exonuclease/phosphatase family protein [Actinomadura darangshiensis]|uniref:endonuclease/exonuclease/phosphatase family protein n=1 Tax=Actinomadura darangshiensis TaxID=705336 RepID=UPI00140B3A80|nr:endonuclease/exonuclease/phosphatase family protein [Actinomadura darangshiensis]